MKSRKKNIKITTIYKPDEQTHYCVGAFLRLSCEKSVKSMCYLKLYIKMSLCTKQIMLSL